VGGVYRDGGGTTTLRMYRSLKPIIGAINGAAVGIGVTMQLPMDIRMASSAARFGFVFARRGITLEAASSWYLPRLVGMQTALEWCLTGRVFDAGEALARGLYKIPKTAEKVAERFQIAAPHLEGLDLSRQAEMMIKAADGVLAMIQQLHQMNELEKIKDLNDRLQYVEGEADKLMTELLRDLYSGRHNALTAIAIRDLYELIEKVVDRCRDVGNVVMQIVLKNS